MFDNVFAVETHVDLQLSQIKPILYFRVNALVPQFVMTGTENMLFASAKTELIFSKFEIE